MANQAGFSDKKNSSGGKLNKERQAQTTIKQTVFGDALVCLGIAVKKLGLPYKEVATLSMQMMGPIEIPFVNHTTADGVIIPYGSYDIDGLGKVVPGSQGNSNGVPELSIAITFEKGADEAVWVKLLTLINETLKEHVSMFKKRAIAIKSAMDMIVPNYIDLTKQFQLFLDEDVEADVVTNVFFPITHVEKMREAGIEGSRGVLLHGPYGTGKTLIAYETAKHSLAKDRTFVLCDAPNLGNAIAVARFMEPSTLFVEDMDVMGIGSRNLSVLRNMLSGVESKRGFDVMTILTTNLLDEVEKMDRSLLRPDRIDAIVEIPAPNKHTVQRIVEFHTKDWLEDGDWKEFFERVADCNCTPAILVEMIKRAKMTAMRVDGKINVALMDEQLFKMTRQIELSEPVKPNPTDMAHQLADSLKAVAYNGEF